MSTPAEIIVGTTVELFLGALALGLLYRVWGRFLPTPRKQRVLAFQRGVLLQGASMHKILAPGEYWISTKNTLLLCDMRHKPFQVPAQDVSASDGMAIRMSLSGEYRVADPVVFTTSNSDPFGSFYVDARQALHLAAKEIEGTAILNETHTISARIRELLVPRATHLGIELTQLGVYEVLPIGWFRQN